MGKREEPQLPKAKPTGLCPKCRTKMKKKTNGKIWYRCSSCGLELK